MSRRTLLLVSGGHAAAASAAAETSVPETLTKPFKFGDLLARVRSLLGAEGIPEPSLLRAGDAFLDLETRQLTVRDETFPLSANELAIAEVLFRQAGHDLAVSDLLGHAREVAGLSDLSPEADLRSLREKLGSELLTTVGLVGYRLRRSIEE
jgi:DNA-binding response OmpR family regulator